VTTFSVPETYSVTLSDEELKNLSFDTIKLSPASTSSVSVGYTNIPNGGFSYTTTTATSSVCMPTISNISISSIGGLWGGAEWVDSFPAWGRIDQMCKEYPGLKIAFENFKTVYNLVKDDYDAPADKKIRP